MYKPPRQVSNADVKSLGCMSSCRILNPDKRLQRAYVAHGPWTRSPQTKKHPREVFLLCLCSVQSSNVHSNNSDKVSLLLRDSVLRHNLKSIPGPTSQGDAKVRAQILPSD